MRTIARLHTVPPLEPGFGGEGHRMTWVLTAQDFAQNDPFIILADDRLDLPPGVPVGDAHPHAGFEIATFVVSGLLDEGSEGALSEGDVLFTTAGRGIVHGEKVFANPGTRILQLWFTLPEALRDAEPAFSVVKRTQAPVLRSAGATVHVYSGRVGATSAESRSHIPLTMLDITLEPNSHFALNPPPAQNGFFYVLSGSVRVDAIELHEGQVAWLNAPVVNRNTDTKNTADTAQDTLLLWSGTEGARLVFYAGEPQNTPITTHGPWVAGSRDELIRMMRAYREGQYTRMSDLVQRYAMT